MATGRLAANDRVIIGLYGLKDRQNSVARHIEHPTRRELADKLPAVTHAERFRQ